MAESDRERWDARYREGGEGSADPSPFLIALDAILPRQRRALDVAGGSGRNALWLARRGLDVTLADISSVALDLARARAEAERLPLHTIALDLESEPLPAGPWDVIVCVRFLWRPLFAEAAIALAENGLLVVAHPTRSNLLRHPRPGSHHLLDDGELPGLVSNLAVVSYEEGWRDDLHEAQLVARRIPQSPITRP